MRHRAEPRVADFDMMPLDRRCICREIPVLPSGNVPCVLEISQLVRQRASETREPVRPRSLGSTEVLSTVQLHEQRVSG